MRQFLPILPALLLFALTLHAKETDKPTYIDPATVDIKALLPAPPDAAATKLEIDVLLHKQQTRTPGEIARAKSEAHVDISIFKKMFGPWFIKEKLPVTTSFLTKVSGDTRFFSDEAKDLWQRPRPPLQDPRIHPIVDLPKNSSYPSGHSTWATTMAFVLSQLAPDLKNKLVARGEQIGDDREIAGVHFPSDVTAGRTFGKILFDRMSANPQFQADLAAAKAEFSAVRPK
jgi:acid phosphatase (class A)